MKKFKKFLPYLICFVIGAAMFLAVIISNDIWALSGYDVFRLLSDACIVPGAVIGGVGALVFAANGGAFDMLSYGILHIFDLFRPNARNEKYRNFVEYKQAKADRNRPFAHMLIVGVFFLILSAIFSFVWYKMNG